MATFCILLMSQSKTRGIFLIKHEFAAQVTFLVLA